MTIKLSNTRTELYTNLVESAEFKYPREYQTDIGIETRQLTIDNTNFITITITGIPDCVSPNANEALIPRGQLKRLYIFSDVQLDDTTLVQLDGFYGKIPYPMFKTIYPMARIDTLPRMNFYMLDNMGPLSTTTRFVEYRHLLQRHIISNIAYDQNNGDVYNLVLPERPLMVIIMPCNFIRTGNKQGYFHFDNNIIVRVFSRVLLSSNQYTEDDNGEITLFSADNLKIKSIISRFFNRLGIHKITSNDDNQIYGYDKYLTFVVGKVSNVVMP